MEEKRLMFANISSQALLPGAPPIPHLCRMDPPEAIRMLSLRANVEGLGLRWEAAERRGGCCLAPLNSGMRDTGQELTEGGSVSQRDLIWVVWEDWVNEQGCPTGPA